MTTKKFFGRLLAAAAFSLLFSRAAQADVFISIRTAPPPLPVYEQPICPGDGYLWTPGYWAYGRDYYWVPGTWVRPPRTGYLWTPPYWGWSNNVYLFHRGYWGPRIGYYGGINYGYGYGGRGYDGGRWEGSRFMYNRSVNHIDVTRVHNTYSTKIVNKTTVINRVSYNGGHGGTTARPTAREHAAERDRHVTATRDQHRQERGAQLRPDQHYDRNQGKPQLASTDRPGSFGTHGDDRGDHRNDRGNDRDRHSQYSPPTRASQASQSPSPARRPPSHASPQSQPEQQQHRQPRYQGGNDGRDQRQASQQQPRRQQNADAQSQRQGDRQQRQRDDGGRRDRS